jgi:hypothetical protein
MQQAAAIDKDLTVKHAEKYTKIMIGPLQSA